MKLGDKLFLSFILMRSIRSNTNITLDDILNKLNIDETFTRPVKRQKQYNKFINSIVPEKDFNYMADLIELPTTKQKYKYLLVVVDLATNLFDIEELRSKSSSSVLDAFKKIINRKILNLPKISLKTDGGTEFKREFDAYLEAHHIAHKTSMPYRHKQMAVVESLNKTLTRLLLSYLNTKTIENNEEYYEWTDVLDMIRDELNKFRERDINKLKEYQRSVILKSNSENIKSKYQVGYLVHYALDRPMDIRGKPYNDTRTFRNGDRRFSVDAREIIEIIPFFDPPFYRYKLKGLPHVSYSDNEVIPSKQKETTYNIKKIIGKKIIKRKPYYLIWWKGYKKEQSTWEPEDRLLEDGLEDYIDDFNKNRQSEN